MFRSSPFKPFLLCDSHDPGILFEAWQSSGQWMFLLERASWLASPCRAGSRASHRNFLKRVCLGSANL
jgi:hypothetical protein